jgi:oligoribonuclease
MKRILWLDVETTGLDPCADYLLELAAQVTDEWGCRIGDGLHHIITPTLAAERRLNNGPDSDVVVPMHTASGLLEEMHSGDTVPEHVALAELLDLIDEHAPGARPGGRNVHYDLRVLDHHTSAVRAALSHRHVDLSTVELLVERVTGVKAPRHEDAAHRAWADVQREIDGWRWAIGMLGQVPRGEEE